ncbi:MAG: hypothetical protein FRX48_07672 [Lasallia pustulata]|uniref:Uncharacterized protein n=1 Tax=Lasallia pustulata TaxID=136370 RepID=A0A5M8PI44_9LECA|nr:MAG: hypothetical protein FRX48_07672 [Lasallia pustulata]
MSYDHGRLYYDSDAGFIEDYESMHGALVRQDFMDYSHQQDRTRQAEASSAGSASRYGRHPSSRSRHAPEYTKPRKPDPAARTPLPEPHCHVRGLQLAIRRTYLRVRVQVPSVRGQRVSISQLFLLELKHARFQLARMLSILQQVLERTRKSTPLGAYGEKISDMGGR